MTDQLSTAAPTADQLSDAQKAEARMATLIAQGDKISQANAVTGIVGDTGTGKTSLIVSATEYCWSRYHRISRVYVADPGGFGNKMLRMIRLGIVEVYNPTNHVEPFETMENLSKGWWPEVILDRYTGLAAPDVRLVPPVRTEWAVYCKEGHLVKRTEHKKILDGFSLQCPECKLITNPSNWSDVQEIVVRAPGVEHVGLYAFESGTSLSDWAMEDMANTAALNAPGTKDGNALSGTGARIVSGAYAFGANTQQHYGFAQNSVRRWIKNSRIIPGMVVPPIWSFLLQRGTDENANMAVFGPKIAGSAKTAEIPSWMGNCLHSEIVTSPKGERKYRLWLTNHMAPGTNIPYLAKTRAEPGDLPPYLEDDDGEAPFSKFSLSYFFDQLERALDKHANQDAVDFPDAPTFQPLVATEAQVISSKSLSAAQLGARTTGRPVVGRPAGAAAPAVAPRPVAAPQVAKPIVATPAATPPVVPAAQAPAAQAIAPPPSATAAPPGRPSTPPAVGVRRPGTPPPVAPRK